VAKIARCNSINSDIIKRMLTKFVNDEAGLLPFNLLKQILQSANTLSNAKATSKGHQI